MWLNLYVDTHVLGFLFEIDSATVSRNIRRVLTVFQVLGDADMGDAAPARSNEGLDASLYGLLRYFRNYGC
jgi:hypothetical protein